MECLFTQRPVWGPDLKIEWIEGNEVNGDKYFGRFIKGRENREQEEAFFFLYVEHLENPSSRSICRQQVNNSEFSKSGLYYLVSTLILGIVIGRW